MPVGYPSLMTSGGMTKKAASVDTAFFKQKWEN
jgi:hypothetical protein